MRDDLSYNGSTSSSCSSSTAGLRGGRRARSRSRSPTSLFEDSLFTLFAHNQPAHGDPGDMCKYTHANLPPRAVGPSARRTTLRYKIAQNSGTNTKLFAHHQWDAGLYLADLIAEQSVPGDVVEHASQAVRGKQRAEGFADVRGKTVVELGAGTGLPGLVACVMGAARTVITDYPDPHVIDNLSGNLDLALLAKKHARDQEKGRSVDPRYTEARTRVQVMGLGWGNDDEESRVMRAAGDGGQGFDLVLAADVLWVSSAHPLLIHSIRRLLKRDREARCVLIAGFHTGRPAVRRFFLQLAQADASGDETLAQGRSNAIVPDWDEQVYGGIWERSIDGSTRAWSGGSISPPSPTEQSRTGVASVDGLKEVEEEMGDISDRGSWVVVATLRWADLA